MSHALPVARYYVKVYFKGSEVPISFHCENKTEAEKAVDNIEEAMAKKEILTLTPIGRNDLTITIDGAEVRLIVSAKEI